MSSTCPSGLPRCSRKMRRLRAKPAALARVGETAARGRVRAAVSFYESFVRGTGNVRAAAWSMLCVAPLQGT